MSFATVSVILSPDRFEPVNTDGLWFQLSSSDYTLTNYKYIVDVYSAPYFESSITGTVSLGSFKIPPRPGNGYGIFTPHKILKSQIINAPLVPISATGINVTYNSMVRYWINYGFETDTNIPYYDYTYFNYGTYSNLFGLSFTDTTTDNFKVGDYIYVDKTNTKVNVVYSGFQTITGIYGTAYMTTDVTYSGVDSPSGIDGGYITSLSRINGSTGTSSTASGTGNYTWNAIRQYDEKGQNFFTKSVLSSSTRTFLTGYTYNVTQPNYIKPTRLGTYETIGFIADGVGASYSYQPNRISYFGYKYIPSGTSIVETDSMTMSNINYVGKFELGVGPNNIQSIFPTMTFDNVDYYKVFISNGNSSLGNVARRIDRICTPYENIQLTWLNRLGSYEYWNFYLVSKKTLNTDKVKWKKQLSWDYSVGDRQQSILSQKANMSYVVNSDYVAQYDYEFLNELITSPEVYRIVTGTTTRIPVIVTDSKWVQKTQLSDIIFNMTLNFEDAHNFVTQDN